MDEPGSREDVRRTYDRIAEHFAATREHPWPEVEAFLGDAGRWPVALDVGCGNGRHLDLLARHADRVLGVDLSRALLELAGRRAADGGYAAALLQGDATALPLLDDSVGLALYVATVHHLPTRAARVASLDELARVLDPEGRALVSAWSTAHERFDAESGFDTTVDWTLPGAERVPRYYHIYDPEEFRADLAESDLTAEAVYVSSGNCYAEVRATRR